MLVGGWLCTSHTAHRLERVDRLADKVDHDCRTAEDLLDDVERKLNEVAFYSRPCLSLLYSCAMAGMNVLRVYVLVSGPLASSAKKNRRRAATDGHCTFLTEFDRLLHFWQRRWWGSRFFIYAFKCPHNESFHPQIWHFWMKIFLRRFSRQLKIWISNCRFLRCIMLWVSLSLS